MGLSETSQPPVLLASVNVSGLWMFVALVQKWLLKIVLLKGIHRWNLIRFVGFVGFGKDTFKFLLIFQAIL